MTIKTLVLATILAASPPSKDLPLLWVQRGDELDIYACPPVSLSSRLGWKPVTTFEVAGEVRAVGMRKDKSRYRWLSKVGPEYQLFETTGASHRQMGSVSLRQTPAATLFSRSERYLWTIDVDHNLVRTSLDQGASKSWRIRVPIWEDSNMTLHSVNSAYEVVIKFASRDTSDKSLVQVDLSNESSPRFLIPDSGPSFDLDYSIYDIQAQGDFIETLSITGEIYRFSGERQIAKIPSNESRGFYGAVFGSPHLLAERDDFLYTATRNTKLIRWKKAANSNIAKWYKLLRDGGVCIAIGKTPDDETIVAYLLPSGLRYATIQEGWFSDLEIVTKF